MALTPNSKSRSRRSHAFAAKISNYQFERVLWQFVLDRPERQAARYVRVSENSIAAIYTKLRKFFFDLGVFDDPYDGRDPAHGIKQADEAAELKIIDFHLERARMKRWRLDSNADQPNYHLAESYWRHDYEALRKERPRGHVDKLMHHHALTFIRRFGPVGSPKTITRDMRRKALQLSLAQHRQQLLWLERNASGFRDPTLREKLRTLRSS